MPTTDELDTRLTTVESQVAQILVDMVTRGQVSDNFRTLESTDSEHSTDIATLQSTILELRQRIASLGQGVNNTSTYEHTQSTTAAVWTITHNLGQRHPDVVAWDASHELLTPTKVEFLSDNVIRLTFGSSNTGGARITKVE